MRNTRDSIALILTACVGIAWGAALIFAVVNPDDLSHVGAAFLYVVGGALVGAVVSYLGGKGRHDE